jgi:hypothetical protein
MGAMRAGIRYVRYAPSVHAVLVRTSAFILFGSALWALLPLVVRTEMKLGPSAYGQLLSRSWRRGIDRRGDVAKTEGDCIRRRPDYPRQRCLRDGHHRFGPPAQLQGVLEREGERSAQIVGFAKTTRPGYSSMGGRVSPEELNLLDVFVPRM